MFSQATHRPRNVDTSRAAAILYGDLGTSKAYVIGLAFALAGYSSFWLIAAVSLLTILIGLNYMVICKYYPNGGGVYASVRRRSKIISLIGAFFLTADFLVTAALSALSAFYYLKVSDPVLYASIFIALIGVLNYFGPRHSGSAAMVVGIAAFIVLTILALFSLPHLGEAWHRVTRPEGSPWDIWKNFVGVIVALSGIEAIANTTGVMKLNPGYSQAHPLVTRTASKAIGIVIAEVAIYTSLFAFVAAAIPNFNVSHGNVTVEGYPDVRDSMLRYLGQVFVTQALGPGFGEAFGWILSIVIGILLLSAVNTAITGLIALQYIMASDGELPEYFQRVNRFGVPLAALVLAAGIPILLVLLVKNVAGLATLYAIGFVGAIATNLGATSTDKTLSLRVSERVLMFISFLIMLAIEMTLFVDKPSARLYALAVITVGLVLRGLSLERKEKRLEELSAKKIPDVEELKSSPPASILCPARHVDRAVKSAVEKSNLTNRPLHILFVREQVVISESDLERNWENDPEARKVMDYVHKKGKESLISFHYSVSDSIVDIISAYALILEADEVFIDAPKYNKLLQLVGVDRIAQLEKALPEETKLTIVS